MLLAGDDESRKKKASDGANWNERMSKNCSHYSTDSVSHNQPNALKHLHQHVSASR